MPRTMPDIPVASAIECRIPRAGMFEPAGSSSLNRYSPDMWTGRPLDPEAHDEGPVGGVLSRRINDQRARQLRVDAGPARHPALGRRRPVVVGTWRRQFEAQLASLAGRYFYRVLAAVRTLVQAIDQCRIIESVAHARLNLGARRNSDQRTGDLRHMSGLGKCPHDDRWPAFRLRVPVPSADFESEPQHAVAH